MRGDPAFRAMLERAGKVWSRRIDDTWTPWERRAGEHKGWLINGPDDSIEVHVGEGGEISTGLEIDVVDEDLPEDIGGWANRGTSPDNTWEPRFGSIQFDRTSLQEAGEASLLNLLTHEIGHVLGSWSGDLVGHDAHTDTAAGTWSGPHVVAEHGGPAPFQDASVARARVGAEHYPLDSQYDFAHSGVCISVMAYCNGDEAVPAFLPHAIDFAFPADLGLTIAEETDRPETYGLAGWTEYAAFTLSLSRELEIALADPQPALRRLGELVAETGCGGPVACRGRCLRSSYRCSSCGEPVRHCPLCREIDRHCPRPLRFAAGDGERQPGAGPRHPGRHGQLHLAPGLP